MGIGIRQSTAVFEMTVIMAAPDYKVRFDDAAKLLQYGFSVSRIYQDMNQDDLEMAQVTGGVEEEIGLMYESQFSYLDVTGKDLNQVTKEQPPMLPELPIHKAISYSISHILCVP